MTVSYTRAKELPQLLSPRILLHNCSMGTFIQPFKPTEAQYGGDELQSFTKRGKGNTEMLN